MRVVVLSLPVVLTSGAVLWAAVLVDATGRESYRVKREAATPNGLGGEAHGNQLHAARSEDLPWTRGFLRRGDGGGADVVGPLTVIQTHYSDPVNENVVLLIWDEASPNPQGVDIFLDGVPLGTVFTDLAFVTLLEAGEHNFRVEEAGLEDPTFAEGVLTILTEQPFVDIQDLLCEEGAVGRGGRCEIVLTWRNPGPLPSYHLILVDGEEAGESPSGSASGAVVPGIPSGRHVATVIGFLEEDPGNPHALYRGAFVETECTLACEGGTCVPPGSLRLCQSAYGVGEENRVRLEWLNGLDSYTGGVNVLLDGQLLGNLGNDADTGRSPSLGFIEGLPPGGHRVGVQGVCDRQDGASSIVEAAITLVEEAPQPAPIEGNLVCKFDGESSTTATWTNASPSEFIDVYVLTADLRLVFVDTLPGAATAVTVSGTRSAEEEIVLQFFAAAEGRCYGSRLIRCRFGADNAFVRGFCANDARALEISSPIFLLGYVFLGGPTPSCLEACDVDADGGLNITDAIYTLHFLFLGGPPPAGWFDGDGDGFPEPTCETAPPAECGAGQRVCP